MSRRIAVLIGNQTFSAETGLASLMGPRNDVAALAKVLADKNLGQFEVTSLIDKTASEIMPLIEGVLNDAKAGDTILLFYAGHGKLDRAGRLCLAAADTLATKLYTTSIPTSSLSELVGQSSCDRVILLLDCCYSGAIGKAVTRGDTDSKLGQMTEFRGLHIFTASTGTQTATELEHEVDGVTMGKFSRAIVDGISSGAADRNNDGQISLSDLRLHVEDTIRGQTPQYWAHRASGDPIISLAPIFETPVQRRLRRLGAWYSEDTIDDSLYHDLVAAACGEEGQKLSRLVQKLLDHPSTTPRSLCAAWNAAQGLETGPISPPQGIPPPPKSDKELPLVSWLSGSRAVVVVAAAGALLVLAQLIDLLKPEDVVPIQPPVTCADLDDDNDGINNCDDKCPGSDIGEAIGQEGCPTTDSQPSTSGRVEKSSCADFDGDGDGVNNCNDKCPNSQPGQTIGPDGCPVSVSIDLKGVNFDFDKSTLRPDAVAILNEAIEILKRYPGLHVEVAGHADSLEGTGVHRQALSERRARAVYDYLIGNGIDRSRLLGPDGYGESRPLVANSGPNDADEPEGRAANRRVELISQN